MMKRLLIAGMVGLVAVSTAQWKSPGTGAHAASQAAADVIRNVAETDGAFLAAGLIKTDFQADNLASILQYPTDEIVVVRLKGSEVRQAFERSLNLYPQDNTSFLQISGFEVEFSPNGDPGKRVLNIKAGGSDLDENRNYTIAMPSSLGRGGSGYFKIWDKTKIVATVDKINMESALRGKRVGESKPRWVSR